MKKLTIHLILSVLSGLLVELKLNAIAIQKAHSLR